MVQNEPATLKIGKTGSVHITAILLLCSALLCGSAVDAAPKSSPSKAKAASSVPADAAALVNGEPLPERIVSAFLKNGQDALGINAGTEEGRKKLAELRQHIMEEQVGRLLIAQEAARRGIAPSDAEIDAVEDRMLESMSRIQERYDEFLKTNHFSRPDYRQYVIRSELSGKAMADEFAKGISVTDEEIRAYYEEHKSDADFQWPERVTVAHILLDARRGVLGEQLKLDKKLSDGPELNKAFEAEVERRGELAQQIREEALQPGADFGALAAKYSEDVGTRNKGGSLGTAPRGMRPFDELTFSLKPGEIAPVVKTDFGYHIIKVLDHRPPETRPLEERAPEIRDRLVRQRQTRKMREWLEEARSKATIVMAPASSPAPPAKGTSSPKKQKR